MASLTLLVISLLTLATPSLSAKIVAFPLMAGSQYIGMKRIGQELVTRGHQFTLLVSSMQNIKHADGITHLVYKVPYGKDTMEKIVMQATHGGIKDALFSGSNLTMPAIVEVSCESIFQDKNFLKPLEDFDLLLIDGTLPCGHILADYLEIKIVEFYAASPRMVSFINPYENLFTVSYVPQLMSDNTLGMSFFQRVKNTLSFFACCVIGRLVMLRPLENLKVKYDIKPEKSIFESHRGDHLILFLTDFALEYAYPIPPNFKMVGPINIQSVKPLPPDLQQLIDSSGDDGAIIVSFGSNIVSMLTKEKVDIMAEAFGRLKQKVIWRLKGYIPSSLSPNIKPVAWLPQNDLLSHEKLKLFVSHVGQNSFYEAGYRGVPVVAIPFWGDQFDNALLTESKGFGLSLSFHELTADQLYSTIKRVIEEPSFRENAKRISRLMSDRARTPVQEAGDWMEYALRHESLAHLRPYSSQLTWYQYFLVDVAVFLVMVVVMVIMVIKYTVRLMCWMCCRRQNKQKIQ